jgi:hypothetical protein
MIRGPGAPFRCKKPEVENLIHAYLSMKCTVINRNISFGKPAIAKTITQDSIIIVLSLLVQIAEGNMVLLYKNSYM